MLTLTHGTTLLTASITSERGAFSVTTLKTPPTAAE